MLIGLIDIETKVVNTAYMQIATYHRARGDTVEWAAPLEYDKYDVLYCSSMFTFTDKRQVPQWVFTGGTGYNLNSRLSQVMERCQYDYSIYPECDRSIVWFSRGCPCKCPYCVVPQKEGSIHSVEPKRLNRNGKYIVVQDNNFFANPTWRTALDWLRATGQPVDFQGVDLAYINNTKAKQLAKVRLVENQAIKISWDDPRKEIQRKLRTLLKYIKPGKVMCYVLIGFWSDHAENLYRVRTLWDRFKVRPYIMSYNENDPYQKSFERWVNRHFYKKHSWDNYKYKEDYAKD